MLSTAPHHIDALTGAASRAALESLLPAAIERAASASRPLALLVIDLDHFKSVNDAFGHARGDAALAEFTRRALGVIRAEDTLFRYGGDEFVALLPGASLAQAWRIAQRLLDEVQGAPFPGDPPLALTLSVGVATFPEDGATPTALFAAADRRSYWAKRGGRGRAVCDDSPAEAAQRPAPLPRPIERDAALAQAHAFLEAAPRHPLALLRIAGPPGMGRTRLLDELRHAAALRGFGVLHLAGDPQLRRRVYGALSRALAEWPVMPHPAAGPRELAQALQRELERRASPALLLALDDPAELDQATLDLLREMLAGQHLAHVALALADAGHPADAYGLAEAARHSARIDLEPLSPTGVHVWLRHTLRWEPPEELVRWFRAATEGIPRRVERGLAYVIDYHLLTPDAGGWRFRYDLLALDLARALEREADGPRHNLPAGLSELVGREAELQQLAALIPQQRLVVLTGPGGIGKTRLALQAAAESLHHFADGVFWVPLAAVTSQDQLADAIAAALGLALSGDAEGGLITALRRKRLLLVMDNVEQLGDDLSPVERLLERAPGVHALLTARTPPALSGAYTMPVAGLPVVAGDDLAAGAVQLLLRRARQADPELVIGEEERAAAGRICRLVEGMPLAIELAAAQARNYTLGQIADALAGSLELLNLGLSGGEAGDGPALPERHRSMAAVLESFWRLLSDEERRVLARLGVFRGGFLGDAARSVAGASPFFLSALVASGYLRRAPGGRYELHELLRQYAAERLAQDPAEHDAAYDRHCAHYTGLVAAHERDLLATRAAQERLRAELGNIRVAWDWAVARRRAADLLRSSRGLARLCLHGGMLPERSAAIAAAVAALQERAADDAEARRCLAALHVHHAEVLHGLSRYGESAAAAARAVELARATGDAEQEAAGLLAWGNALIVRTNFGAAHERLSAALHLARAAGVRWVEAACLEAIGYTRYHTYDYAGSEESFRQALAIFRELGDRRHEASALSGLGNAIEDWGDPAAGAFYAAALAIFRKLGDRHGESAMTHNIAVVDLFHARYTEAQAGLERALEAFIEQGSRFGEALARYNLARLARDLGDREEALRRFHLARELFHEIGNREMEIAALNGMGVAHALLGQHGAARERYDVALELCRAVADRRNQSRVLANRARLLCRTGEYDMALAAAEQALQLARQIRHPLFEREACTAQGCALLGLGRLAEAEDAFHRALLADPAPGHAILALEARAGLAATLLQRGDIPGAQEAARPVAEHALRHGRLDGKLDAPPIYLAALTALRAAGDKRAGALLTAASRDLRAQAQHIANPATRRAFERLREVRAILKDER